MDGEDYITFSPASPPPAASQDPIDNEVSPFISKANHTSLATHPRDSGPGARDSGSSTDLLNNVDILELTQFRPPWSPPSRVFSTHLSDM